MFSCLSDFIVQCLPPSCYLCFLNIHSKKKNNWMDQFRAFNKRIQTSAIHNAIPMRDITRCAWHWQKSTNFFFLTEPKNCLFSKNIFVSWTGLGILLFFFLLNKATIRYFFLLSPFHFLWTLYFFLLKVFNKIIDEL